MRRPKRKAGGLDMPTIEDLPASETISELDKVPLSQDGVTRWAYVAEILASVFVPVLGYSPINRTGDTMSGAFHMGAYTIDGSAIAFTGGTLNNVAIGGTTRAAGAFTTLAANAATTLTGSGTGLAVTNNATVGGTLGVTGAVTIGGKTTISGGATGSTQLLNVAYTLSTSLPDGNTNPTRNLIDILSTGRVNGQQFWANFDQVEWRAVETVPGGDVISRYMEANRRALTPGCHLWAGISAVNDFTGVGSAAAGGILVHEFDLACNGADDAASSNDRRSGIAIALDKRDPAGSAPYAAHAIAVQGPPSGAWHTPLLFNVRYRDAVIDMNSSVLDGAGPNWGIRLGAEKSLVLDAGGNNTLVYEAGTDCIEVRGRANFRSEVRLAGNTSSGTATAGAATLPGNPVGFLVVRINGTDRKIPYYAT